MAGWTLTVALACLVGLAAANHESWPLSGGFLAVQGTASVPANPAGASTVTVLVRFPPNTFRREDPVVVHVVSITSPTEPELTFDFFPIEVLTQRDGFRLDVTRAGGQGDAWAAPLELEWVAQARPACRSHSQCPDSQYCDVYGGCDDIRVCLAIGDTFDGGACPGNAAPLPGVEYRFTDTLTGTEVGADGLPEPCRVCPLEHTFCGTSCVMIQGAEPDFCGDAPSCAVDPGRGSSEAYGAQPLNSLTTDEITERKATLARQRADSIFQNHLSPPRLDALAARVHETATDILSCIGVVCDTPGVCQDAVECHNGQCPPLPNKPDDADCNDGDACTTGDVCRSGVCVGVPVDCTALDTQCAMGQCNAETGSCVVTPLAEREGLSCNDQDACTTADVCSSGVCAGLPLDCSGVADQCNDGVCVDGACARDPTTLNGTVCDDGVLGTDNDQCVDGVCRGQDLCDGVMCLVPGPCHEENAGCFRGQCPPLVNRPNGTSCDDDDPLTDDDVCTDGVCAGTNYCLDVICDAPNQCQLEARCVRGTCVYDAKAPDTPCDDGDDATDFDYCFEGECAGIFQPTAGPLVFTMAYQTEANLEFTLPAGFDDEAALLAFLREWLLDNFPGVYDELLQLLLGTPGSGSGPQRRADHEEATTEEPVTTEATTTGVPTNVVLLVEILVATSPFGTDYIVNTLNTLLRSPAFQAALVQRFPALQGVVLVGDIRAVLRCLTPVACPAINCASDEMPYQSSYISARKCCPVCIKRRNFFAMEMMAYQAAVEHWMVAQDEQDRLFEEREFAAYRNATQAYDQQVRRTKRKKKKERRKESWKKKRWKELRGT